MLLALGKEMHPTLHLLI